MEEMNLILDLLEENLEKLFVRFGMLRDNPKDIIEAEPMIRKAIRILGTAENLYNFSLEISNTIEARLNLEDSKKEI